jgi:hypothetical protein
MLFAHVVVVVVVSIIIKWHCRILIAVDGILLFIVKASFLLLGTAA